MLRQCSPGRSSVAWVGRWRHLHLRLVQCRCAMPHVHKRTYAWIDDFNPPGCTGLHIGLDDFASLFSVGRRGAGNGDVKRTGVFTLGLHVSDQRFEIFVISGYSESLVSLWIRPERRLRLRGDPIHIFVQA